MKTQRVFLFLVLIASLIGIMWVLSAREPRYQGRTLTRWLQQYHYNSLDQTQRIQEAQSAIRAIGAQKALPKLLNLVETRDDPVSLWIIDKTDKYRIRFLKWSSSESHSYEEWQRIR